MSETSPLRIYLASAFSRQAEIKKVAVELESMGVDITSRWLDQPTTDNRASESFLRDMAWRDLADLRRAEIFVRFSDPEYFGSDPCDSKLLSGARFWETGFAFANGKRIIVVGGRQNVFDRLDRVLHLADADALKNFVKQELAGSFCGDLVPPIGAGSPLIDSVN